MIVRPGLRGCPGCRRDRRGSARVDVSPFGAREARLLPPLSPRVRRERERADRSGAPIVV